MEERRGYLAFATVASVAAIMFVIALVGLPNLAENERRIADYVVDVKENGNWICQRDASGEIASKPPLYTWIAAIAFLPFENLNRFVLYFPSALGTLATSVVIVAVGRKRFGAAAGLLAGLVYLLSPMGDKQMHMARYDALFAFTVALAAFCAYRAWQEGRGWTWFWLAGAAATLVKGPLGVVLGASGLLAALWEKRSGNAAGAKTDSAPVIGGAMTLPLGSHLVGISLFILICGGWLWLAYLQMGQPVIDKLIGRELVGHALTARDSSRWLNFYKPLWHFLAVFAPWSAVACYAFWRVLRRPSSDPDMRRFERFLFCWFVTGLVLFALAAHHRDRLIFPLVPAAALLTGRELARWLSGWSPRTVRWATAGATVAILIIMFVYQRSVLASHRDVQRSVAMREMAREFRARWGEKFPVTYVDAPFALSFYLREPVARASFDEAARFLGGKEPVCVAVSDVAALRARMPDSRTLLHEVARWPATGKPYATIVSNVRTPTALRPYRGRMMAVVKCGDVSPPFLVTPSHIESGDTSPHSKA